ncbi:MAG: type II toxin-antitoxin system Phd/YefM family antitoxin [Actinomycetes bacterium]
MTTTRAYPGRDVRAGRSSTERGGHETVPSQSSYLGAGEGPHPRPVHGRIRACRPGGIGPLRATEAHKHLYKLLDGVSQSHEPVQITGKRGNAVLVSEDDWRAVQETLYLVSIPGMRESILEGLATPAGELEGALDW